MGRGAARPVRAAGRDGRLGRSVPHDEVRGRSLDRRRAAQIRRERPALSRRSEEHTSELQSLMRISYAVFCLKKKKTQPHRQYDKITETIYHTKHATQLPRTLIAQRDNIN